MSETEQTPDLLEALKQIIQLAEVTQPHELQWFLEQSEMIARDAVSKAEGRA